MATVDDVRAVASQLPRTEEALVHDRVKFRVRAIVYAALSRDESILGFGFPKEERDALVASDPERFLLPRPSDMRFQWVQARLALLDAAEVRELVVDAWRMVVPPGVSVRRDLTGLLEAALASGDDTDLRAAVLDDGHSPPLLRRAFARAAADVAVRPATPVAALETLVDGWASVDAPEPLTRAAILAYGAVGDARPDWRDDEVAKLTRLGRDPRPAVRRAANGERARLAT